MVNRYKTIIIFLLIFLFPLALFAADGKITGKVTDTETGDPLPGANVTLKGSNIGTISDRYGVYVISGIAPGNYTLRVSFIGYEIAEKPVMVGSGQTVTMDFALTKTVLSGATIQITASRARERETPVAFTDVSKEVIVSNLGSRDIPMALNTTPSVYATQSGGGAGDARINVRGFNQRNVAILINGMPVNDMENGWLYWSNWDGLGDVTESIQVQRGLSAINLAVPSIGGALNIITDPTALERSITYKQEYGDGGFLKSTAIFNSGLINDKFAFTAALVRKVGDGVIHAAWADAWAYYFASSYQISPNNRLELVGFGAPQRHGQNLYRQNIGVYHRRFAEGLDDYDRAALTKYNQAGRRFNQNWAPVSSSYAADQAVEDNTFERHDSNSIMERENFFHKPLVHLNWFSRLSDNLGLYNILYYSGGTGGGTGTHGSLVRSPFVSGQLWFNSSPWTWDWDATIARNGTNADGSRGVLRNSRNNQWTIGAISKLEYSLSAALKVTGGIDYRTAEIEHYREVRDLLGGDYYRRMDSDFWSEEQQKRRLGDKIDYNFTNTVDWVGVFGQAEYSLDRITAYGMAALSNIKYNYTNHFRDDGSGNETTAETDNISGVQLKGGASYRLTDNVHIYGNVGFVDKVPIFDNVINDRDGTKAADPKNEGFLSVEGGVNFRMLGGKLSTKVSAYYTEWKDRANSINITNADGSEGLVFLTGMDILHQGIEIEAALQPNRNIRLDGAISVGNWEHTDDVAGVYKDYADVSGSTDQNFNFYVKNLKVGDAPQTQVSLGSTIFTDGGVQLGVNFRHYRDFYADWDPFSRTNDKFPSEGGDRGVQSWKIPDATVVDLHATYQLPFNIGGIKPTVFGHVFNLFDKLYIQDALDNSQFNSWDGDHDADDAEVFFGLPRFFNVGISLTY